MHMPRYMQSWKKALCGILFLASLSSASAQETIEGVAHVGRSATLTVPIYKSQIVALPAPAKRVSIGNPDIADVLILRSTELYILGKDLGTTNVLLWDQNDVLISAISVSVTHDIEALRRQLTIIMPGEKIQAASAQRNIVLSGQISSAIKMDAALQVARGYLQQAATAKEKIMFKEETAAGATPDKKVGEVINLMSVGGAQEVMLMVKVAEIQRSAVKKLNVQFAALSNTGQWVIGGVNGGATFPNAVFQPQNANIPIFGNGTHAGGNPIGPVYNQFQPNTPSITNQGLFFSYLSKEFSAAMYLDVAQQQGMAKILAEPNVTTLTGQEATFLSGGSFPIPVPEQNGTIGVQYKDFGVKLIFQPLILESGRINLKLNISVSQLTSVNSLVITPITSSSVFAVPALTERSAVSTVELSDGQTIGIAGLMNENMNNAVNKFPGLGDIPILGTLFRSQAYQKGQTELVIFVTPRLAKPIEPANIQLPTDNVHEPSNLDFYLNGKVESAAPPQTGPPAPSSP